MKLSRIGSFSAIGVAVSLCLTACGGGGTAAAPAAANPVVPPVVTAPPPEVVQGISMPSSVAVVTATNAN